MTPKEKDECITPITNFSNQQPKLQSSNPPLIQLPQANHRKPTNTAIVTPVNSQIVRQQCNTTGEIIAKIGPKLVNAVPPLVNMSPAAVPRVQTIQLTPQKQQTLKNVQNQIQQLSARLQNKSLLSTITQEYDPTNPLHNKPLPSLDNMDTMTDTDIHAALQRLFIEQQKILSTGKIIPTISAAHTFAATPPSMSPIAPNNNNAGVFASSNHTVPSPVHINSPQIKQEIPTSCSPPAQLIQNCNASPLNVNNNVKISSPGASVVNFQTLQSTNKEHHNPCLINDIKDIKQEPIQEPASPKMMPKVPRPHL